MNLQDSVYCKLRGLIHLNTLPPKYWSWIQDVCSASICQYV